mgnify:CR=1 FL=1
MSDIQNDLIAKQRAFATDRVRSDVGNFYDGLVTEFKKQHNRLPEYFFKKLFLPYFSGQKTIEEGSNVLADWFSVAGSHTAEVTIIDDKSGESLFDVPAVGSRSRINSAYNTDRQMMSIEDVAVMAANLSAGIAERGQQFAASQFSNRLKVLLDKNNPIAEAALSDLDKDILRWNEIFKRYGLKSTTSEAAIAPADKSRQELDDDMIF